MKIVATRIIQIYIAFFFLTVNQALFAQVATENGYPNTIKLSLFKKEKRLFDTILPIKDTSFLAQKQYKHKGKEANKTLILKHKIAADGSEKSTILKLEDATNQLYFSPIALKLLKIRIAPAQISKYSRERIGSIESDSLASTSTAFYYNHPIFKDSLSPNTIDFEVYTVRKDSFGEGADSVKVVQRFSMQLLQPGIVMVHGLNSSSKEFHGLYCFLKRKKYKKYQLLAINYPDSLGFVKNMNVVPKAIDSLLFMMEKNLIISTKVDLIGHSMGGIMSRLYVQGEACDRKDVNRLITCNTPHSGSPVANFVRDSSNKVLINKIRHFGSKKINLKKLIPDPNSQAVMDLQIGSDASTRYSMATE